MRRIHLLVLLIAALAGGLLAAGVGAGREGGSAAARQRPVTIKTFQYSPDPIRVEPGTTIRWTNRDATVHTVTAGTRSRRSNAFDGRLEQEGAFSHRFDRAGTYRYFCARHSGPGMTGKVVVG